MIHDVRCPSCKKLLFKAEGFGARIEIQCDRCKSVIVWPVLVAELKQIQTEVKPIRRRA